MNINYYLNLVKRAIENPLTSIPYVKRKIGNIYYDLKYWRYPKRNGIPSQKRLVHELVEGEEEFVLIILDACRYDYFEEEYQDFFEGDLQKAWSPGNRTPKWMPKMWTDEYDLTYLTTSGYAISESAYETKRVTFDPAETFDEIIPIQERDPVLTTVVPERVTDAALHHFANTDRVRAIVHYMQPHKPLVGEKKIIPYDIDDEKLSKLVDRLVDSGRATEEQLDQIKPLTIEKLIDNFDVTSSDVKELDLYERQYWGRNQIEDGVLTDKELREAYRSNLWYVLNEVQRLVEHLDCRIIISSDHGEHLGEYTDEIWRYNHPDRTHPVLREVPWFDVAEVSKGKQDIEDAELNPEYIREPSVDSNEQDLEEHLRALGYK